LGVRGPKSKIEEKRFVECHTARKWLESIEKQKRIDLKEQRDKQTYRRTDKPESTTKNNRLLG